MWGDLQTDVGVEQLSDDVGNPPKSRVLALQILESGLRFESTTVDRRLRLGAPHPPRPHSGDERRQLQAPPQPGERRLSGSRRPRRRIVRTVNAVSSPSCNVATPPDLLPSVFTSVVHHSSAPVPTFSPPLTVSGIGWRCTKFWWLFWVFSQLAKLL